MMAGTPKDSIMITCRVCSDRAVHHAVRAASRRASAFRRISACHFLSVALTFATSCHSWRVRVPTAIIGARVVVVSHDVILSVRVARVGRSLLYSAECQAS